MPHEYCHITTPGTIDYGPAQLPDCYGLVSALPGLSPAELLVLGWLPVTDTADPLGPWQEYGAPVLTVESARVLRHRPAVTLPDAAIVGRLRDAVQAHMDTQAQAFGYDDIKTAVTYADEPAVPKFQAEGLAFRSWRSRVWAACYAHLDAVTAGTAPVPASAAELIALLPALEIPA